MRQAGTTLDGGRSDREGAETNGGASPHIQKDACFHRGHGVNNGTQGRCRMCRKRAIGGVRRRATEPAAVSSAPADRLRKRKMAPRITPLTDRLVESQHSSQADHNKALIGIP